MFQITKEGKVFTIQTDEKYIVEEVMDRVECKFQDMARMMEYQKAKESLEAILMIEGVLND